MVEVPGRGETTKLRVGFLYRARTGRAERGKNAARRFLTSFSLRLNLLEFELRFFFAVQQRY